MPEPAGPGEQFLRRAEPVVAESAHQVLTEAGVVVRQSARVQQIRQDGEALVLELAAAVSIFCWIASLVQFLATSCAVTRASSFTWISFSFFANSALRVKSWLSSRSGAWPELEGP